MSAPGGFAPGHVGLLPGAHLVELGEVNPLAVERNRGVGDGLLRPHRHQRFIPPIGVQQSQLRAGSIGLVQPGLIEMVDVVIFLGIGPRNAHVDDGIVEATPLSAPNRRRQVVGRVPAAPRGPPGIILAPPLRLVLKLAGLQQTDRGGKQRGKRQNGDSAEFS